MISTIEVICTLIYLFGVPLAIIKLSYRWSFINKISPMMVLYIVGLLVGNIGIVDGTIFATCKATSNVIVLLAIPLMLLGCNFKLWSTKNVAKAFFSGLFSVLIVTIVGFFLFHSQAMEAGISNENYAKISAVMTGIYIGGIPNLAPISKAVDLPQNLFLLVSSYDLIVTGLYLIFVVFCGKIVMRKILPPKHIPSDTDFEENQTQENSKSTKKIFANRAMAILLSLLIAAISYVVSMLIPIDNNVAVIILTLTTLSIILSFWKPVKRLEKTFDMGLYFVYVFCLSIATMVNVSELQLLENLYILYYIFFAVFGSLLLQIILAKIFKIDGDTVLVSSIALINSPPFVPMVAAILKNKDVILTGITIGLLGYALGNYLGIGIFLLLR